MKIIRVSAVNAFGLREIDFNPNGKSVVVKGRNGAGKSSLLRATEAGLLGAKGDLSDVVYKKADKAGDQTKILIELGETDLTEMEIERVFGPDGKALGGIKMRVQGIVQQAPARLIANIVRSLSFNPIAFYLSEPRKRRDLLMKSMPVHFSNEDDFGNLFDKSVLSLKNRPASSAENVMLGKIMGELDPDFPTEHALDITSKIFKRATEVRQDAGQQVRVRKEALSAATGDEKRPAYDEDLHIDARGAADDAALIDSELSAASRARETAQLEVKHSEERIALLERQLDEARVAFKDAFVDIEAADKRIARAQDAAREARADTRLQAWAPPGVSFENVTLSAAWQKITQEFETARRMAQAFDEQQQRASKLRDTLNDLTEKYDAGDTIVTIFRDSIPRLLTDRAEFSIAGLTITDDDILVGGIPIEQRSNGEKLMFALQLAEAQLRDGEGEKIETMLVDGVEQLDPDNFDLVESYARDNRIQLIMTKVDRGDLRVEEVTE